MDENLARLERQYPDSKYVAISAYNPDTFKDRTYDSAYDVKSTVTKWKSNPLTYAEAQAQLEKGNRVGWIVPEGYVIVDIDNKDCELSQEKIEGILEKFEVKYSYNYTSKGMHLLFKDPSKKIKSVAKYKCALNIEIDTRANETGYIVLPSNDPHREWGFWGDFVEDIPYFLKPVLTNITPSFIGLTEGDGRNDALFKWRTLLERCHNLEPEEIEKSIRIINENLFETPITNNELFKTVLRETRKEKVTQEEKENLYNKLADEIIGKYDLASYYSNYYKFNGIYYAPMSSIELEQLIHFEVSKNIASTGRKEIVEFIKLKTQVPLKDFDKDWYKVAVANGVLNLVTGELEQPNKSDINTVCIPFNYNPDPVYSPRIDNFMIELTNGDPVKMMFLYQIAGYCLLKKNLFEKFFIFKGEGGTGKSTFTNLIQKMVGAANASHISLSEFDKDYYLATLVGKLVNIDDDVVDGKALEGTGRFKSIISGNVISVRQIYREVMDFVPYVTCIFSCNRLPKIMDRTTGLYRRMVLIELNNKVLTPDPLFMNKVTDIDMEYFLFKAVEGIKTAIEEGRFKIMQSEEQLLDAFRRRQSPLNEWLYENEYTTGKLIGQNCNTMYKQFSAWCDENGYGKKMTSYSFRDDVCALYGVKVSFIAEEGKAAKPEFVRGGESRDDFRPF